MSELHGLADRVAKATDYTEIFGPPDDVVVTPDFIKGVYRKLARILHPDLHTGEEQVTAQTAFKRLGDLRDDAETALEAGIYGQPILIATIRTRRAVHEVRYQTGSTTIVHTYRATTSDENRAQESVIRVARSPADNDLVAAEAAALKRLHATDNQWTRHYPVLLDSFTYQQGARRRANALAAWPRDHFTLEQLIGGDGFAGYYPKGLDPRHVAWIWRRLLMALGNAHDQGIIHGAVLPSNVLIEPADHAVILTDWCYSSTAVDGVYPPIKALADGPYKDWGWFPEEIIAKKPPSPATDLVMAAQCMIYLLGGLGSRNGVIPETVPRPMRAFFRGCLIEKQSMRPQDAGKLLEEFDDLLEMMGEPFHPRRFIEFAVPAGVA